MKDIDKISRLIFLAFVARPTPEPIPLRDDGTALLSWPDAMELYADAVRREESISERLELLNSSPTLDDRPDEASDPEREPPVDLPEPTAEEPAAEESAVEKPAAEEPAAEEPAAKLPDTHTHTARRAEAPTNDGGCVKPGAFAGVGAGEKKQIHTRLLAFCAARPGVTGKLAKATNGLLDVTQIYDMRESGKHPMAQWRAVNAAMDWIESQESQTIS